MAWTDRHDHDLSSATAEAFEREAYEGMSYTLPSETDPRREGG